MNNDTASCPSLSSLSSNGAKAGCPFDLDAFKQQLELLGCIQEARVYLRYFYPSDDPRKADDKGRKGFVLVSQLPDAVKAIEQHQNEGRGCYFVINDGGDKNADITSCRAVFYEHDDLSKENSLNLWQILELPEPTFQVDTGGKSIHSYWVFDTATEDVSAWRSLQSDLLEVSNADRSIKNPARVMRAVGAWHRSYDVENQSSQVNEQTRIVNASGNRYNFESLRALIPSSEPVKVQPQSSTLGSRKQVQRASLAQGRTLTEVLDQDINPRLMSHPDSLFGDLAKWTRAGKNCACPFCTISQDDAFNVAPDKPTFFCYGCQAKGSFADYVMLRERVNFPEAVRRLASLVNVSIDEKATRTSTPRIHPEAGEIERVSTHQPNEWKSLQRHNYERGYWIDVKGAKYPDEGSVEERYRGPSFQTRKVFAKFPDENGQMIEQWGVQIQSFDPKMGFDFHISRYIETEGGALQLRIERLLGNKLTTKDIVISSTECDTPREFVKALKRELKANINMIASHHEIQQTLQVEQNEYYLRGGKTYRLASVIGRQPDGYWVFRGIQFTPDGQVCTEEESLWIYNENVGVTGVDEISIVPHPAIKAPQEGVLRELVLAMKDAFRENFMIALTCCGIVAASVNDAEHFEAHQDYPIANLQGNGGGAKTFAFIAAMSLVGMHRGAAIAKASESAFYQVASSLSSLPFFWDDPKKSEQIEVDERVKTYFNRKPRVVSGKSRAPKSTLTVASNFSVGDTDSNARSRVVHYHVPVLKPIPGEVAAPAFTRLEKAMSEASGAFSELIGIGYDAEAIVALTEEMAVAMNGAHARSPKGIALHCYYTQKIAELAGVADEVDVKHWFLNTVCKNEIEGQSNLDSVTDFLEKLSVLRSTDRVGDWNLKMVKDEYEEEKNGLYVYMPGAWEEVARLKPDYSRSILEGVLKEKGALKERDGKKIQMRFNISRDATLAAQRSELVDSTPVPTRPLKCIFIPISLIANRIPSIPSIPKYPDEDTAKNPTEPSIQPSVSLYPISLSIKEEEEEEEREDGNPSVNGGFYKEGHPSEKQDTRIQNLNPSSGKGSSRIHPEIQQDTWGIQDTGIRGKDELTDEDIEAIDCLTTDYSAQSSLERVVEDSNRDRNCQEKPRFAPGDVVRYTGTGHKGKWEVIECELETITLRSLKDGKTISSNPAYWIKVNR